MIHIENLTFHYQSRRPIFEGLNLDLSAGNIYGLLGKNGAGKTTLLKIVSGLLFPKDGTVMVDGFQPKDRYPQYLQEIYVISEEFSLPSISIDRFIRLYSPFYPRFKHERFNDYVYEFKLPREQNLSALSYGQKKNFLLSFGLATDCKLLILDEPTNGLDIPSKSQFRKIVANALHEERSFIVSTHQVRDMENLIDPIIILEKGEIVFYSDYETIASKLSVIKQSAPPDNDKVIYSEYSPLAGYTIIKENSNGEETRINLELLFNAVVTNPKGINQLLIN